MPISHAPVKKKKAQLHRDVPPPKRLGYGLTTPTQYLRIPTLSTTLVETTPPDLLDDVPKTMDIPVGTTKFAGSRNQARYPHITTASFIWAIKKHQPNLFDNRTYHWYPCEHLNFPNHRLIETLLIIAGPGTFKLPIE